MSGDLPTISQLECFIIYGRVGNFARAAQEAHITQSAFSAQIKHLETTLGITLIQRSKRGSQLTEEGEAFLTRITAWTGCGKSSMRPGQQRNPSRWN